MRLKKIEQPKPKKNWPWILLAGLGVLLACGILFTQVLKSPHKPSPKTPKSQTSKRPKPAVIKSKPVFLKKLVPTSADQSPAWLGPNFKGTSPYYRSTSKEKLQPLYYASAQGKLKVSLAFLESSRQPRAFDSAKQQASQTLETPVGPALIVSPEGSIALVKYQAYLIQIRAWSLLELKEALKLLSPSPDFSKSLLI